MHLFTVTFANLFVEQVEGHRAFVFSVSYKRIKGLREGKSAADREHWSDTLSTDYYECISVCAARLDTKTVLTSSFSLTTEQHFRYTSNVLAHS